MLAISLDPQHAIVTVEPQGKLQASDFKSVAAVADPMIEEVGFINGIIIMADKFDGWESFSDLLEHIQFVKDHHKSIKHVVVVSASPVLNLVPTLIGHFIMADVKVYSIDEAEQARDELIAVCEPLSEGHGC